MKTNILKLAAVVGIASVSALINTNLAIAEKACCSSSIKDFAPISVMGAHLHKEGEWMFGYSYMYGAMTHGTNPVKNTNDDSHEEDSHDEEGHNEDGHTQEEHQLNGATKHEDHEHPDEGTGGPAPMAHKHLMQHEMHMLDVMYGVSDDFNLMAMVPFVNQRMRHLDPAGNFSTENNGMGDIALTAMHSIHRGEKSLVHGNMGISFPTADIDDKDVYHGKVSNHPYMMQIGSGTFDLLPGLTYQESSGNFGWGAQGALVVRLGRNNNDYAFGDRYQVSSWLGYQMSPEFRITSRLTGKIWDDVTGADDEILITSKMANPRSQAGRLLEGGIGGLYVFQSAALDGHSLGLEASFPIAQSVDDGFMEQDWALNASWRIAF